MNSELLNEIKSYYTNVIKLEKLLNTYGVPVDYDVLLDKLEQIWDAETGAAV